MSAPTTAPDPGTRLGDFVLESVLGAGGGGTVYAALWGHREVALKVLREDLLSDASERRRFLEEARLLAEINHPGVVRILGFGELPDGRPYLAMERLPGESLAERVARGPMPLDRALELFGQVAQAVHALHGRGLVHRDIKPENIFLVQGERYAVLLDFGIAKPLDAPDSTVTRQGGVRGTPAYMAPERFFGAAASPATDIYELGVVLFAMLTARLPWEKADDPVTRLNPMRPSELGIALPGRLEAELLRALSTRAEARPATVAELAERVGLALVDRPAPGARRTADMDATGPQPVFEADQLGSDALVPRASPGVPPDPAALGRASTLLSSPTPAPAVTRDLRSGATGPSPAASHAGSAFAAMTTTSRATGQRQPPLPALPAPDRRAGPRSTLLLIFAAVAIVGLVAALVAVLGFRRGDVGVQRPATSTLSKGAGALPRESPSDLPSFDRLLWGLHAKDTYLIIRIHHEELRKSATWRAFRAGIQDLGALNPLRLLERRCKLDLLRDTTWLSVGLSGKPADPELDAVLRGTFDRAGVEACIRTLASAGDAPRKEAVHPLGRISRVQLGEHFVYLAWPDARTLMISTRKIATEGWYEARLAHRGAARERAPLWATYRALDPAETLWMVTTEESFEDVEFLKGLPKPIGTSLTIRAREALQLRGAVIYTDPAEAARAETKLRQNLQTLLQKEALLKFLLDKVQVARSDRVLTITFHLDDRMAGLLGTAAAGALKESSIGRRGDPGQGKRAE